MKASEMIANLTALIKEHGDLDIYLQYQDGSGVYRGNEIIQSVKFKNFNDPQEDTSYHSDNEDYFLVDTY